MDIKEWAKLTHESNVRKEAWGSISALCEDYKELADKYQEMYGQLVKVREERDRLASILTKKRKGAK